MAGRTTRKHSALADTSNDNEEVSNRTIKKQRIDSDNESSALSSDSEANPAAEPGSTDDIPATSKPANDQPSATADKNEVVATTATEVASTTPQLPQMLDAFTKEDAENQNLVSTLTRPYFAQPFITRVNHILTYANAVTNVYSIRRVPTDGLHWGTYHQVDRHLCIRNMPITVWLVGDVEAWFFTSENRRPTALKLHFLFDVDFQSTLDLLKNNATHWQGEMFDVQTAQHTVMAKAWPKDYAAPGKTTKADHFERIVDATNGWNGMNADSTFITPADIKVGELVLLEVEITRQYDGGAKSDLWSTGLRLRTIAKLLPAPSAADIAGKGARTGYSM